MSPREGDLAARAIAAYVPASLSPAAAAFARAAAARAAARTRERAKALLYAAGRLAGFGESLGMELKAETLLREATIERFARTGCDAVSAATRRTLRTNLRALARAQEANPSPAPAPLPRERARPPYSQAEIERGRTDGRRWGETVAVSGEAGWPLPGRADGRRNHREARPVRLKREHEWRSKVKTSRWR